jgi:hypothetical protein
VQNSIEAGASEIELAIVERGEVLTVRLTDDGAGMDPETLARAQDPFYTDGIKHPERTVGLGIPFLRQLAEQTGGSFQLDSRQNVGTTIGISVPRGHWDVPPLGDLAVAFQQALSFEGAYEMMITHTRDDSEYTVRRSELAEALGDLDTAGSQSLMRDYIRSQEDSLESQGRPEYGKDDTRRP